MNLFDLLVLLAVDVKVVAQCAISVLTNLRRHNIINRN